MSWQTNKKMTNDKSHRFNFPTGSACDTFPARTTALECRELSRQVCQDAKFGSLSFFLCPLRTLRENRSESP